jgi:hypothetical protein
MSNPPNDAETVDDPLARAIRNLRAKKQARLRMERAKASRDAAVKTGEARTVSVAKYAELSGLHPATIRRRIADGTLRATKLIGKGKKWGPVLIYVDQLG